MLILRKIIKISFYKNNSSPCVEPTSAVHQVDDWCRWDRGPVLQAGCVALAQGWWGPEQMCFKKNAKGIQSKSETFCFLFWLQKKQKALFVLCEILSPQRQPSPSIGVDSKRCAKWIQMDVTWENLEFQCHQKPYPFKAGNSERGFRAANVSSWSGDRTPRQSLLGAITVWQAGLHKPMGSRFPRVSMEQEVEERWRTEKKTS